MNSARYTVRNAQKWGIQSFRHNVGRNSLSNFGPKETLHGRDAFHLWSSSLAQVMLHQYRYISNDERLFNDKKALLTNEKHSYTDTDRYFPQYN